MGTWHDYLSFRYHPQRNPMREFSVPEIETYATRAQASAAFATAINALQSLAGLDIFSSEEQEALNEALEYILEVAHANDARIKVTEETLHRFEAVKTSQKALVALISLLDGLKKEAADGAEAYNPTVPIKDATQEKHHRTSGANRHYTQDGEHAACGERGNNILLADNWSQVTCSVCLNLNQL